MAEESDEKLKQQNDWVAGNIGESYTQAFKIRQVMYRIQDMDLPFKRGIRVEQFLMFLATLFLMFIVTSILIYPVLRLLHIQLPITFHLAIWLAPPIFMAVRVGKPMPHQKTMSGTAASFMRYNLDDRWHARGLPLKSAPYTGLEGNYSRTWTVDPAFQKMDAESDVPATEFADYTNQDFPDGAVRLPGEAVEKRRILEDEDEFMSRLMGGSSIGATDDSVFDDEDVAPVLDRSKHRNDNHKDLTPSI